MNLLGLSYRFVIRSPHYTLKFSSTAKVSVMVMLMVIPAAGAAELKVASHCTDTELIVFSCQIKSSKKYLSVCASRSLHEAGRYLQYRFGALTKKEFEFPTDHTNSFERFKISHYFRANVDRRSLAFTNNDTKYVVFSDFEGEESPSLRQAGVRILTPNDTKTIYCTRSFYDRLDSLESILEPVPDSL